MNNECIDQTNTIQRLLCLSNVNDEKDDRSLNQLNEDLKYKMKLTQFSFPLQLIDNLISK